MECQLWKGTILPSEYLKGDKAVFPFCLQGSSVSSQTIGSWSHAASCRFTVQPYILNSVTFSRKQENLALIVGVEIVSSWVCASKNAITVFCGVSSE